MKNRTIRVESIAGISFGTFTNNCLSGDLKLNIYNEYPKMQITDAKITVYVEGSNNDLITISSTDKVTIPKKNSVVSVPLNLEIKGGVLGSVFIANILKNKTESIRFSINGKAKKGVISVDYNRTNLTIDQVSKLFNIDKKIISGLLDNF